MEAQSLSTCNQCGKKFQRKAHLLRHQQQHSGDRPYSCKFCSKTFKRSDVLRDHFSRCELRGSSAIPNSLERGRKRHACDECSRLKVKCDNTIPCRKCREFGRNCVKIRPHPGSSPDEATPDATSPDTMGGSDRNSIGFLLNSPGESDFMHHFPKSSTQISDAKVAEYSKLMSGPDGYEAWVSGMPDSVHSYQYYSHVGSGAKVDALLSGLDFAAFERLERRINDIPGVQIPEILWSGSSTVYIDRAVLDQRALDIREKLYQTAAAEIAPNLPSKDLIQGIDLMTADSITTFIKLYFRHWHRHCSIIHQASFNPCTAALPLVLATAALGAMYSKDPQEVVKVKLLLDTIESYIYSLPGLNNEYDLPGRIFVKKGEDALPEWQQYQLEELQGAYLIIPLQYWAGTRTARKRVRQSRFSRFIEIYRYLDMNKVQHSPKFAITDQQSFEVWIRKEAYIRTATIALMLDNAFGIFNNISPRLQWSEIDLPFPSDDRCFQVASYQEYVTQSQFPPPKMKIKEAFLMLFASTENGDAHLQPLRAGNLNALNMQMLIHTLYTYLWTHTFASPIAEIPNINILLYIKPFKAALQNWKKIWDESKAAIPLDEWNQLGFQRTAEMYYDAVKALIQSFEKRQGKVPLMPSDCDGGEHLKRLMSF